MAGLAFTFPVDADRMLGTELIQADTGLTGGQNPATVTVNVPTLGAGLSPLNNFRNMVIGGDFSTNLFQRGTSVTIASNASSVANYAADCFFGPAVSDNSNTYTFAKTTITPGSQGAPAGGFNGALNLFRVASQTGLGNIYAAHLLDTSEVIRSQGQTVTLSFWARADSKFSGANSALNVYAQVGSGALASGNQGAGVTNAVGFNGGVTGGAATWTNANTLIPSLRSTITPVNPSAQTQINAVAATSTTLGGVGATWVTGTAWSNAAAVSITTTWQRYSVSFNVPTFVATTSAITQLGFAIGYTPVGSAPAANTDGFFLLGVQFEIGSAASPFEFRRQDVENLLQFRRCYRIAEPIASTVAPAFVAGQNLSAGTIMAPFPVAMRAVPALTLSSGSWGAMITGASSGSSYGLYASGTVTSTITGTPLQASNGPGLANISGLANTSTLVIGGFSPLMGSGGSGFLQWSADL
jgi:hypothetical protein